jgi:hypothetical protein
MGTTFEKLLSELEQARAAVSGGTREDQLRAQVYRLEYIVQRLLEKLSEDENKD